MGRLNTIWTLLLQFAISLALLLGVLWIVHMFISGKFSRGIPGRNISIIERKYIDRNSSIVLVRLMDDYYFILITQSGGTVIKNLDEIEAGKVMTQEGEMDFKKIFRRRLGRKG